MLFIELALIRWLGANVLYLAYFSNVVLLGSFLGIGLGFLWTSRGRRSLFPFVPVALATLIVLVRLLEVKVGIAGGSLIFFGLDTSGPPRWVILPVVFVAVAAVMTCVGDGVARAFQQLANLDAYQLDLVGSLLGIAAFALLAYWRADPVVWGAIAVVGLIARHPPASAGTDRPHGAPAAHRPRVPLRRVERGGHPLDAVLQGAHGPHRRPGGRGRRGQRDPHVAADQCRRQPDLRDRLRAHRPPGPRRRVDHRCRIGQRRRRRQRPRGVPRRRRRDRRRPARPRPQPPRPAIRRPARGDPRRRRPRLPRADRP